MNLSQNQPAIPDELSRRPRALPPWAPPKSAVTALVMVAVLVLSIFGGMAYEGNSMVKTGQGEGSPAEVVKAYQTTTSKGKVGGRAHIRWDTPTGERTATVRIPLDLVPTLGGRETTVYVRPSILGLREEVDVAENMPRVHTTGKAFLILGSVGIVAYALLFGFIIRKLTRTRALLADGKPALGALVEDPRRRGKKGTHLLRYRYSLPAGGERDGKCVAPIFRMMKGMKPKAGDRVWVVYDDAGRSHVWSFLG